MGAGAAELIFRSVLSMPGPVLTFAPAFGEYRRCAEALGREVRPARDENEFLDLVPLHGCAFVCLPNNPDGRLPDAGFLAEASRRCRQNGSRLVLDLAYRSLSERLPELPEDADWMFAPNKPFAVTGVRAGWMRLADAAQARRLTSLASAWCVGTQGVALLEWSTVEEAHVWLRTTRPRLWEDRGSLAEALRTRGVEVRETAANWLLARAPRDAWSLLLAHGVRVRDTTTMGLPGWLRLSSQSPGSVARLLGLWDRLLTSPWPSRSRPTPREDSTGNVGSGPGRPGSGRS